MSSTSVDRNDHTTHASRSAGAIIFALSIGAFAIGTAEFASMALVPYLSRDFGVSEATAAHAISAYALGVVIGAPVLAVWGSRLTQRTLLVTLMLAFCVANTLSAIAPNFGLFAFTRFLSGLPHGAYFGVAALVAAGAVAPDRKARAVSKLFLGLTVATIIGVPAANYFGQSIGWRWGFAIVAILAVVTAFAVFAMAPHQPAAASKAMGNQLSALRNRQVLLTLATGAVGFGGFFAIYTYIASTMMTEVNASPELAPLALAIVGIGMTIGMVLSGWAADRNATKAAFGFMIASGAVMLVYPSSVSSIWLYIFVLFMMGVTAGLPNVIQARLLEVSGDAQQLASALNQSAFNVANALGPLLASLAIGAGFAFSVSGYVAAALTGFGMLIFAIAVYLEPRKTVRAQGR